MAVEWTVSTLKDYSVRIHTLILPTWLPYYRIVTIKTLFTPLPIPLTQLFIHKFIRDYALRFRADIN